MTTLQIDLTSQLQTTLGKEGVWAYAVYFDSDGNPQWNTLVDNGAVQSTGQVAVDLPEQKGLKIYVLIQSQDSSDHTDLTSAITQESDINWGNASSLDFRFDSFEVTLQNSPFDQGNLTSVQGFGLPMEVSVTYDDGTTSTRGYGLTGQGVFDAIAGIDADKTYIYDFASGPLADHARAAVSPTEAVGGGVSDPPFAPSDWSDYLQAIADNSGGAYGDITIAGFFNGAADANGIYHNAAFYAYTLSWDGTYFWLDPTEQSQVQGHVRITQEDLQDSIYSTLGSVEIFTNKDDAEPYQITGSATAEMNTGLNNQWGAMLAQFLTGFTAGFYGVEGASLNSQTGDTVDLNKNWNWDPTYGFGSNLAGDQPVYMDPYSEIFFKNSNSYGSAYSDALMRQYSVGGPLIAVSNPDGTNVDVINLTLFDDGETPAGYEVPYIGNYLAPQGGSYAIPQWTGAGTNFDLSFSNQGVALADDTPISLEILKGYDGGEPTWYEVTLDPTSSDLGLWQVWNLSFDGTEYSAEATGTSKPVGGLVINLLPTAEEGISWYRLTVGEDEAAKTFNIYTTTSDSEFLNPTVAGQEKALAVDGLATIAASQNGDATIPSFTLNFLYASTTAVDPSLVQQQSDANYAGPAPYAPVAGTIVDGVFNALDGQDSPAPTGVAVTQSADVAFGWTGTNSYSATSSWISGLTNKVLPGQIAQIDFTDADGHTLYAPLTAVGDIDGQWQTSGTVQLGEGTVYVTMTEYAAADGTQALAQVSQTLVLDVDLDETLLTATPDGGGLLHGEGSLPGSGSWVRLQVQEAGSLKDATLLFYAIDGDGNLIGRDGQVGGAVTVQDATLASIGAATDDHGGLLFSGGQSLYLPVGQQLRVATLQPDGTVNLAPDVSISDEEGSVQLTVGDTVLSAQTDTSLSDSAILASSQRMLKAPFVYLEHGASVDVDLAGSCGNTNTLGFVRFDIDAKTGAWSVGGVSYGDTDAFEAAVRGALDDGFHFTRGGEFQESVTWTVDGKDGYYAPVLITQNDDLFVIGDANAGGMDYIRTYGENTFGFEDLAYDQNSDFDFNDMVMRITPHEDAIL